jgi:hypothetical protein
MVRFWAELAVVLKSGIPASASLTQQFSTTAAYSTFALHLCKRKRGRNGTTTSCCTVTAVSPWGNRSSIGTDSRRLPAVHHTRSGTPAGGSGGHGSKHRVLTWCQLGPYLVMAALCARRPVHIAFLQLPHYVPLAIARATGSACSQKDVGEQSSQRQFCCTLASGVDSYRLQESG